MRVRSSHALALAVVSALAGCQQILGIQEAVPARPTASVPTASIDFGPTDCGAATPSAKTVTIRNTGAAELDVSASLPTSAVFALIGGASVKIPPGKQATLTVTASIPQATTAGSAQTATLTLATNDPASPSIAVALRATASGGTLTLDAPLYSFATVDVGTPAPDIPITLANSGNAAIQVSLGAPTDPQFTATYMAGPNPVSVPPNTSLPKLVAHWTPLDTMKHQGSIPIVVQGAVCGVSVTAIPLAGTGTNGAFTASTGDLLFGPKKDGMVDCGAKAAPLQVTIGNTGNKAYAWTATTGASFSVSPQSGTVPAGQMVMLTVTPLTAIPAQSATTADLYSDALTVTTDIAGDQPHVITLHETAHGAIVAFTPADAIDFGSVTANTSPMLPLAVGNTGNAPVNVSLSADNVLFAVTPLGPSLIPAAGSLPAMVTFSPGTTTTLKSGVATASAAATDVLCAPLPPGVSLTGTGLDGVVSFGPSAVDFGTVDCGTTALAKVITFSNPGSSDYTITPKLGLGASSPYKLTMNPASGLVAKGQTATITLTPSPIPFPSAVTPNLYGDLLTVTTDVVGDQVHYIPITETAGGALLALEAPALAFGASQGLSKSSYAFNNTGNQDIAVIMSIGGAPPFPFSAPFGSVLVPAGGSQSATISFSQPFGAQSYAASVSVSPELATHHVLCAPLPFTSIALSGQGVSSTVTGPVTTDLEFPSTPCGATPPQLGFTVDITVPQIGIVVVVAAPDLGAASPFTVIPPQVVLPPNFSGNVPFTVIAKPIPAVSSTLLHALHDTVSVAIQSEPVRKVFLHATALGAIVTFNEATVAFPPTTVGQATGANGAFYFVNHGNVPVPLLLSLADTADFGAQPSSFVLSPFPPRQIVGSFTPASTGMKSSAVTLTLGANPPPLCAPLPNGLSLTGTGN